MIFRNSHFERVRQIFADQFEPDGSDFLYRKSMKGGPVRVSRSERDAFISTFNRRLRYSTWSILPATLLLIGLLVVLAPDSDTPSAKVATYLGIGLILVPFLAGYYWAWNAPARELERRPLAGEAYSREEVRKRALGKITYGQLALVPLMAVAMLWKVSAKNDVLHGWGRLWLLAAVALILLAAVQASRKWLFERRS